MNKSFSILITEEAKFLSSIDGMRNVTPQTTFDYIYTIMLTIVLIYGDHVGY